MLNCDCFQQFKHTRFSVGVLYLSTENLPRELRFKRENILIVGIIPGPSININSYLEPLIDELLLLWDGIAVTINGQKKVIQAALSCIACDVLDARKVGGFIGHKGNRGCSICLKEFNIDSFGDYPDYSSFKLNKLYEADHDYSQMGSPFSRKGPHYHSENGDPGSQRYY